jgi:aldehyde dehydrogenase (NAD+)
VTTTSRPQAGAETREPIPDLVDRLRRTFDSGRTRPAAWRLRQLRGVEAMLADCEDEFTAALASDLGRPAIDSWLIELAPTAAEAAHARKRLNRWMRPRRVRVPLAAQPGRAWYVYQPVGVVLVVSPWNYPVYLSLGPLVGALAAGNCAVIKPSEHTPATSALLRRLVADYLDSDAVTVVEGGADETQGLLEQGLDHVLFTGSAATAKAVMATTAKHLTPVTLELGGKSPVIVAADAAVELAARRVAWAKLLNAGQTCVAPDYALVDRRVRDRFVAALTAEITRFQNAPTLPLINSHQAERLAALLADSGGTVVLGGQVEVATHRATPTVVLDPEPSSGLLQEEIFGPVLPVVSIDSVDDAISFVNDRPQPLALYLFSESAATQHRVVTEINNGATVINHLALHLLVNDLPFGGVGASGMGAYHGEFGFATFSHAKAVLRKRARPDPSVIYPPYSRAKQRVLRRLL